MNATQIVSKASNFLDDPGNVRFSVALILEYINEAQRDFARSTGLCRKLSLPLQQGSSTPARAFYLLPDDFLELAPGGVWNVYAGQNIQLQPLRPTDIGDNWDAITGGTPSGYIAPGEFGWTQLRVWPAPTSVLTALTIYYVYLPDDLVTSPNPTTSPIMPQYHVAFAYYAVSMCYQGDGQYRDPAKAQLFMDRYKRELMDAEMAIARRFSAITATIPFSNV